jgi:hypothetical protein
MQRRIVLYEPTFRRIVSPRLIFDPEDGSDTFLRCYITENRNIHVFTYVY